MGVLTDGCDALSAACSPDIAVAVWLPNVDTSGSFEEEALAQDTMEDVDRWWCMAIALFKLTPD